MYFKIFSYVVKIELIITSFNPKLNRIKLYFKSVKLTGENIMKISNIGNIINQN